MTIPFKSDPADLHQRALFPGNVFDLLPEAHDCFLFHDLFQQLDTSTLEAQYSPKGQHAYHPRQIISILWSPGHTRITQGWKVVMSTKCQHTTRLSYLP